MHDVAGVMSTLGIVMTPARTDIPYGYCQCGCGELAPLATQTRPERGQVRGQPISYIRGHNNRGRSPFDFDAYDVVDLGYASPCWIFRRAATDFGYIQMRMPDGRLKQAHCAFYEHHVGLVPRGMTLDHLCHTHTPSCPGGTDCPHRRCCNPEHMEPVSRGDNARRGRSVKLTPESAADIKYLIGAGWRVSGIASAYEVSTAAINHIKRGSTWAHV